MLENKKTIMSLIITIIMVVEVTQIAIPGRWYQVACALEEFFRPRGIVHTVIELGLATIAFAVLFMVVWTAVYYALMKFEEVYKEFEDSEED